MAASQSLDALVQQAVALGLDDPKDVARLLRDPEKRAALLAAANRNPFDPVTSPEDRVAELIAELGLVPAAVSR
jgi:hypothetical protein